jgi:uncharacterized damage-inducible protein DinB
MERIMSSLEKYRHWYEHEKDSNAKMLAMIASVPVEAQSDPRFNRALVLAAHLAACRENWLDRMTAGGNNQTAWWPETVQFEDLPERFAAIEKRWTDYLAGSEDDRLDVDFDFPTTSGASYRWNIEGQVVQLVGHAFYHRGQIALLVDQLGGKTEDTDYLFWEFQQQPERWKALSGA